MQRRQTQFLFLNIGHFFDHLCMLIFATAAALRLADEWQMSYAALIPYATPGFVAFALAAIPAGWLADRWSRQGMMVVFFVGLGASALLTALAQTPLQIAAGLTLIGVFAAIYHPVGLAMIVHDWEKTGVPLALNGVFGNMGVAAAALLTGFLIDSAGWRSAFALPGLVAVVTGLLYLLFVLGGRRRAGDADRPDDQKPRPQAASTTRAGLLRVFAVILFTTAIGGLIFQSTTFALPKVFDERLADIAETATRVGGYAFLVFALAAFAQLVVGYLVDNYHLRRVFALVALAQALLFLAMIGLDGLAALLVSIAFMLAVFGQIPINDVLVGRMARSAWRSRAFALRYIVSFSIMASAVPMIAWIHQAWGFDGLFRILALAAACIFGAVLLLPGCLERGRN